MAAKCGRGSGWAGRTHRCGAPGFANLVVRPLASRILGASADYARDLMVHCAQEMNHLAGFLPALYEQFGAE